MNLFCKECDKDRAVVLQQAGPHFKGVCPVCGGYIKFLSKSEVAQITEEEDKGKQLETKLYTKAELNNWKEFKPTCKVYIDTMWVKDTCQLQDVPCRIENCFAFQVVKLIKGYF